jgi:exosortase/archaeosortase family protein
MLPLFILFSLKTHPEPKVGRRDIAIGICLLVIFLVLFVALRFEFGVFFASFRVDMLLLPLAIAALVCILFGSQNVRKFKGALFYTLLASPALLYLLLVQSNSFIQFNSVLVYDLIKPFISTANYLSPITISANGQTIAIGQACVSLGIFIGLALFLIPVAYFYEGAAKKKAMWVASGVLLLFILNLARMFGISFVWLAYGPNTTALYVHQFIGVLLFYIVIIAMILTSSFYGLGIAKKKRTKKRRAQKLSLPLWAVIAVAAFCALYICLTLNYSTSLAISPLALNNRIQFNFSNAQISAQIKSTISKNNFTSFLIATQNGTSVLFTLVNGTINGTEPLLLFYSTPSSNVLPGIESQNKLIGRMAFLNRNGIREETFDLFSNNTEFSVYYTDYPFELSNASTSFAGVYLVIPTALLPHIYSCNSYDTLYSALLGIVTPSNYNQTTRQNLLAAECLSDKIVWA